MGIISIDLGTTNIKVAAYNKSLQLLFIETENVKYLSDGDRVEFDAEQYFEMVSSAIRSCCERSYSAADNMHQIVLTGQAESLIMINTEGKPLRKGISWLDTRSKEECEELTAAFDEETCFQITGQPAIIPTWPITKMLWIRKHEPHIFSQVAKYLMLKDYIQFRLTGKLYGEYSIYNFTHYFDIRKKQYWEEMIAYCGVSVDQLPQLVEPCTNIGAITRAVADDLGLHPETTVNVGTLDHFAGMIGTGNIREGIISESTGTVLSIATMVHSPVFGNMRIPCHYGPFKDTYVLLPVCESGGISLEWFKGNFLEDYTFSEMNVELQKKKIPNELIFLPYITGVNAPDFNPNASGVFYGIKLKHDKLDFTLAIMEGVVHLLKKNMMCLEQVGVKAEMIISTGGGARSELWSQMKSDITEYIVAIPENEEAACLGAAMIGAVSDGLFPSYEEAVEQCVAIKHKFMPKHNDKFQKKHELFNRLFDQIIPVYDYDAENEKLLKTGE